MSQRSPTECRLARAASMNSRRTWSSLLRPGVSVTKPFTSPMPSTGPCEITTYAKGRDVALSRNPFFHPWSFAAQPRAIPDEIRFHLGPSVQAIVDEVLSDAGITPHWTDQMRSTPNRSPQSPRIVPQPAPFGLEYAWNREDVSRRKTGWPAWTPWSACMVTTGATVGIHPPRRHPTPTDRHRKPGDESLACLFVPRWFSTLRVPR